MEEEFQQVQKQKEINIIGLMKNPQQFRNMFEQIQRKAGEKLIIQQFQSAIDYFLKCFDMLDVGKNLLSNISPFTKVAIFINLAAAYQGSWKIQKCNKYCQKCEEELLNLIDQQHPQQFLKVCKYLVVLKFQHCAILSQLNNHEKALETCKSTLSLLQKAVQMIYSYSKKQEDSINMKCSEEGVIFSKKVYGFAHQILSLLSQQLADSIQPKQSKSSIFYFWERNPQKNEEQLKKIFLPQSNNNSKRSILGVNKQNHWVDQFNIGSIMRMSLVKAEDFQKNLPMEEYLFKDRLYEIVIHCSLSFFTIATEMRFIDSQRNGEGLELKSDKEIINKLQIIKKKYGYQEKSQMFKLSEAYHLRAIEIVSTNIQTVIPYLTHMIKSYDKHYVFKKKLQEITALGDESVLEMSSVVHHDPSKNPSKIHCEKSKIEEDPYGQEPSPYSNEIATINRQNTEEDDEQYNDYQQQAYHRKEKSHRNTHSRKMDAHRQSKEARNTAKFFHSQNHEDLKNRTKSVGKFRKGQKLPPKEEKTERMITLANSNAGKTKKKREKDKEKTKEGDGFKKTMRLGEYDGQGQLHVRTKSSTHIKFVFKKKK